jgi:hypothetical protein
MQIVEHAHGELTHTLILLGDGLEIDFHYTNLTLLKPNLGSEF